MFLAAAHWGRCACAIWAVPPVPFGALFSMNHLGKREFHRALSFVSSSTFSVSHFQVTFSTNRALRCHGVGHLLHDCIELHVAVWSGCRCLFSCLQHQPRDACASSCVICSSPAAVSPFGQRTFAWAHAQICCLSKGQRQCLVRSPACFRQV